MKVTSSWIKDLLGRTMLHDQQVVEALERAGLEVEQVISSKEIDKKVKVALVKKVIQHPGADRLHLVDVLVGESEFRVVCGAPNVREGMKVALAQIGTVLPSGDRIAKAKLRGEVSEGMLCSELELGLGTNHNGILEVSSDVAAGTLLCDVYPADAIIDLKTPANRFDVLSVVGLAREVAALTSETLLPPTPPAVETTKSEPAVQDGAEARRYLLAQVKADSSVPSPRWMTTRLRAAGMRSLGPVVDITNYVMLELGQPLHAFDLAKVKLPIGVRHARAGETLTTLDGVDRKLTEQDLVIADQTGPIGLAGLMGGANSEVDAGTTEILLEAAAFDATTVRKMAKRHGLRTEASARFERGLPVELSPLALARAVELLQQVALGQLVGATDQLNEPATPRSLELSTPRLSRLLGFELSSNEIVAALNKLGIVAHTSSGELHKGASDDTVIVPEVPWWRPDVRLPEDVAEELVRVMGYDKVPSTIPPWRPKRLHFDRARSKRRRVRDLMYGAGLFEVMTYSFVSAEQLTALGYDVGTFLKLKNPLSSEQAYLRSSLLPSHLGVMTRNRTYAKEVGFYEISNVFVKKGAGEQPDEPLRLGVTIYRPEESYACAKGILDALAVELNVDLRVEPQTETEFAPGRSGVVRLDGRTVGRIGQVHPEQVRQLKCDGEVAYFELDLASLVDESATRQFSGVARFPQTARDVAVIVPTAVTWQMVADTLGGVPNTQLAFVSEYYGEGVPAGHRSLALRLTLSHPDRTPTEAEAAELEMRVRHILERKLGAQPRE
jgi:phenylalanyl-tRNA synthetase beta chain